MSTTPTHCNKFWDYHPHKSLLFFFFLFLGNQPINQPLITSVWIFSFVIILVLRSKKDKYKNCCELYWIWLTVWFVLNLNLSRLKVPCHLFPAPHKNEVFTQFRNCARSEDKYQSCLSAPSPTSQPRQLTHNLPSLGSLTLLSCAFNFGKMHFEQCEDPARAGCPCKGVKFLPSEGHGSGEQQLCWHSTPGVMRAKGGRRASAGARDPLVSSTLWGTDSSKCTFPEQLMCTQAASSQAGNMAVLGCFTQRAGIYELLKSVHGLKQEQSNSILQTAFIINFHDFSSLNGHLRVFPLQSQ